VRRLTLLSLLPTDVSLDALQLAFSAFGRLYNFTLTPADLFAPNAVVYIQRKDGVHSVPLVSRTYVAFRGDVRVVDMLALRLRLRRRCNMTVSGTPCGDSSAEPCRCFWRS